MTAKERARRWLGTNIVVYTDEQVDTLEKEFKEQDEITRRACSHAVQRCTHRAECVKACMNVKAV